MVKSPEVTSFPPEQIDIAAKAVCAINYRLADGSYSLDLDDGSIMWTLASCFRGSLLSDDAIGYMLAVSIHTIDRFNDMFMMLKMGILDLDTFRQKFG